MSYFPTTCLDGPELEKLAELRAKTDRQILGLLHSRLAAGLNLTVLAEQTYLHGIPDHAEQLLRRAEEAVSEVKRLLPVLTEDQHRSVGPPLNKLQKELEHLGRNCERPRGATA